MSTSQEHRFTDLMMTFALRRFPAGVPLCVLIPPWSLLLRGGSESGEWSLHGSVHTLVCLTTQVLMCILEYEYFYLIVGCFQCHLFNPILHPTKAALSSFPLTSPESSSVGMGRTIRSVTRGGVCTQTRALKRCLVTRDTLKTHVRMEKMESHSSGIYVSSVLYKQQIHHGV